MNLENFETASSLFYEGLKLIEKKQYHFAEELFRKSLFILPGRLSTIINLTAVLVKNSKYEEVINIISEVNDTDTNDPLFSKLYINLGNALKGLGQISDAIPIYCKATKIDPYSVEAFNNYGEALRELGLFDESEKKFSKCIELNPDYADAYSNLGVLMLDIGELKRSEKYLSRAISLSPDKSEYYCNLSVTLKLMGQYKNAESCIENAIKLDSTDSVAYCIHGNILTDLGLFKNAEIAYKKAITIKPEFNEAKSNLLLSMSYFSTNASSNTDSYNEAVKIGGGISKSANPKFCNWNKEKINNKIRVGFVSGDFKSHPVGYFIQGLLKFLDKNEFEIFGFATIPQKDKLTKIIKAYFTDWIPIYGKSDFEAANFMHKMHIHILIDLSGHTAHNRLGVFSYKPAPIQVSWLGYFATTGLPEMDYFFGDNFLSPNGEQINFSEKLINLRETWFCLTPPDELIRISSLPAIENGYITFGSFANLSKMGDETITIWADILNKIPKSKLFLKSRQFSDNNIIDHVKNRFLEYGINKSRLLIEGPSTLQKYYSDYNFVDIILDTFPYPGGTTSLDALWMGVPVLTLKGDCFLGRLGETIAFNAGQYDWVAYDKDEYVNKAISFSSDYEALALMRNNLRQIVLKSPLFDPRAFAYNFGNTLKDLYSNHVFQNHSSRIGN